MALVPFYEGGASDAQEGSPTYEGDASVQYPYSDPSWQAISSVEEGSWNQGLTEWHPQVRGTMLVMSGKPYVVACQVLHTCDSRVFPSDIGTLEGAIRL